MLIALRVATSFLPHARGSQDRISAAAARCAAELVNSYEDFEHQRSVGTFAHPTVT
jgi:hypothetical protein